MHIMCKDEKFERDMVCLVISIYIFQGLSGDIVANCTEIARCSKE